MSETRQFKYQKTDDKIISLALMAYNRGASISGIQKTVQYFYGKKPGAEAIINWKRKFGNIVCSTCSYLGKHKFCGKRGQIIKALQTKCKFYESKLISAELVEEILEWFRTSYEWRPYGRVGHPNKTAKLDPKTNRSIYHRERYLQNPVYARTLVKHPEKLYSRIALRKLSPEEKAERLRKIHREWAANRNRKRRGDKFNEEMSRRGRRGAEKRWNRKYT